jgi:glycosyltransferase involved in cell wall biosynthesis
MVMDDIGVVIPAYNVAKTIGNLIEELIDYGFNRENIIVVDDGSKDGTNKVVSDLRVCGVRHPQNMGKGFTLRHGFNIARKKNLKKILTLDADGQHRTAEVKNFMKLVDNCDLIIGTRRYELAQMPFLRKIVNRTVSLVVSLLSKKYIPDAQCGFRYLDLKIFDKVKLETKNFQVESEMVVKAIQNRYRVGFVPVTTLYNSEKSYINPVVDTIRFINMAVRFLWR